MAIRTTNRLIDGGIGDSPATQSSFMNQGNWRNPTATGTAATQNTSQPAATQPATQPVSQPATAGTATGAPANAPAAANTTPATVNVSSTGTVLGTNPADAPAAAPADAPADAPAAGMTIEEVNKKIAAAEKYAAAMWKQGKTQQAISAQSKLDGYYRLRNELSGTTPLDQVSAADAEQANLDAVGGPSYVDQLDAAIANLLNPTFIGFQGDRAAELRRLQNLRNQLFGSTDAAGNVSVGSVGRQQQSDAQARRRLAAQRASAGMLQGGAYAGTERGLGTIQEENQAYAMQELLRPFQEQTASDRLQQFGLGYDPTGRNFNLLDFGNPDDIMGGWAAGTFQGRQAAETARNAAVQQFLARGITV